MKKYIPFLIITSLLLSACSFNGSNKEDLFQKKQECIKYKDKALQDLKEKFSGVFMEESLNDKSLFVNDIFYSPVKDSCFYQGEHLLSGSSNFVIVDLLSNRVIYHSFFSCGLAPENNYITTKTEMQQKCLEETQKRTKQLKGEIPLSDIDLDSSDKAYQNFKKINS